MNLMSIVEVSGGIVGTAIALAVVYATLRSQLPQTTITLQTASITALEKQNELLKVNISELTKLVVELKARVSVLETIPLKTMTDSLATIAAGINALHDLGIKNSSLIAGIAATTPPTITINK